MSCSAVLKSGANKGQKCDKKCEENKTYCSHHRYYETWTRTCAFVNPRTGAACGQLHSSEVEFCRRHLVPNTDKRCTFITKTGQQCKKTRKNGTFCTVHAARPAASTTSGPVMASVVETTKVEPIQVVMATIVSQPKPSSLTIEECEGCHHNSAGQRAHMGPGGCLSLCSVDDIAVALDDLDLPVIEEKKEVEPETAEMDQDIAAALDDLDLPVIEEKKEAEPAPLVAHQDIAAALDELDLPVIEEKKEAEPPRQCDIQDCGAPALDQEHARCAAHPYLESSLEGIAFKQCKSYTRTVVVVLDYALDADPRNNIVEQRKIRYNFNGNCSSFSMVKMIKQTMARWTGQELWRGITLFCALHGANLPVVQGVTFDGQVFKVTTSAAAE